MIPSIKDKGAFSNIIYVDPTSSENGDGSKERPYNSFDNIGVKSNTAYLIKAGTVLEETILKIWNNNYLGRYGIGDNPIISQTFKIGDGTEYLTIDSIDFIKNGSGSYDQIIRLPDGDGKNITISNCKVIGTDNGKGYPFYNLKGSVEGFILYHCEFAYSRNDGIYGGGFKNSKFVSNYFHHQNMSGLNSTNGTGDGIQFENADVTNTYFANNYIDRSHTIWKFALIINSTLSKTSGFVAEWNTFVSAREGNGGAAVRWLAGSNNRFNKNLINTYNEGVPGIATYDAHANQTYPYGIRDNIEVGHSFICNVSLDDASNKDFSTWAEYEKYLASNSLEPYGSDIDPENFWNDTPKVSTNKKPIAHAGNDISVKSGETVQLDGTKSYDPEGSSIYYVWEAPVDINLIDSDKSNPSFVAPEVNEEKSYIFSLTVNDGELSSEVSQVTVTVNSSKQGQVNSAPVAKAGINRTVYGGELISLDGSQSTDPDQDEITCQWKAPDNIFLSDDKSFKTDLVVPDVEVKTEYVFSLDVTDGYLTSSDQIVLTVLPFSEKEKGVLLEVINVIASEDDGNIPENTLDNSLETRWSAEGEGQWIQYELTGFDTIKYVKTAWYKGLLRKAVFDIQISDDASQWETILPNAVTSGLSDNFQVFDVVNCKTKYIRVKGFCNNENKWNSITEIELYGIPEKKENDNSNLTSIVDADLNDLCSIYPNPTQGRFNVNININESFNHSGRISIINTTGQRITERAMIQSRKLYTFDLSTLPDGIYFVNVIINEKLQSTKKILIK